VSVEQGNKDLFYGLVDCSKNSNLCDSQEIKRHVEIRTFSLKSKVDAVINFLNENADDICNEETTIEKINSGDTVFVLFKIVKCKYCREAVTIWKDVEKHFATRKDEVLIGKIDCNRQSSFCDEHGLSRYPRFYWYKNHKKSWYKGDREASEMIKYAEEKLH
jgi:hypothetical protein